MATIHPANCNPPQIYPKETNANQAESVLAKIPNFGVD